MAGKGGEIRTDYMQKYAHLGRILVVVYTELAVGTGRMLSRGGPWQKEVDQRERPFSETRNKRA